MAHAASHSAAHAAHGDHGHDHGHFVIPQRTLLVVFGILLLGTLATVAAAQIEVWFAATFNVVIPQWVNVAVALSIAAVKSTVVALYFMQLRYDNPFNSLVVVFTLFTLAFFLGFTMLDLGSRKALYDYKGSYVSTGGQGNIAVPARPGAPAGAEYETISAGTSIAQFARVTAARQAEQTLANGGTLPAHIAVFCAQEIQRLEADGKPLPPYLVKFEQVREQYAAILAKKMGHAHADSAHADQGASANHARVRTGLTLPEFSEHSSHGRDSGHSKDAAPAAAPAGEKPAAK